MNHVLPSTGTLLGVWAHPDDEAYLSAGLMALARQAGHRVVVLTATRGEHGTGDPVTWPPERLAGHREQELEASLAVVGVREHAWMEYADGSLHRVRRRDAVAAIERTIRDVRPDTIVTFGPDGMTGHSDHRVVSSWVTEAWCRTGRLGALWYATLTPRFHRRWGPLNTEVGLWMAAPPTTPEHSLAAEVRCTGPLLEAKHQALRAHASQTAALEELVGTETYRAWWSSESFVAVDAAAAVRGGRCADVPHGSGDRVA
jgi:LmbE family N-acetylglucosaminyl deacetylase